jgi:PAS domain S-box-containing protein
MLDLLAITDGSMVRYEVFLQRVHDEDRQRVDRDLRSTRTSGEPYVEDFRIQRPGGGVCWLHAAGRAIPRADGTPERVRGIAIDVTERPRRAEAARTNHRTERQTALVEGSHGW